MPCYSFQSTVPFDCYNNSWRKTVVFFIFSFFTLPPQFHNFCWPILQRTDVCVESRFAGYHQRIDASKKKRDEPPLIFLRVEIILRKILPHQNRRKLNFWWCFAGLLDLPEQMLSGQSAFPSGSGLSYAVFFFFLSLLNDSLCWRFFWAS